MKLKENNAQKCKVLAVCIITPHNNHLDEKSYFDEFINLIKTNNIIIEKEYFIFLREIVSSTFLTKGKLEEVHKLCLENDIDEVIFSEPLSPSQENVLNKYLGVTVYDRTRLILEIFEKRAYSAEAKLQTQIAFLEFKKTRVSGKGINLSQQGGGIGTRGLGETQKEIDLRHIDHLLVKLRNDMKHLYKIRDNQRKQRLRNNIPLVSLTGYTNAGKSTLFNLLTKENIFAEDKLFATLDTTTREVIIESKKVLFSDTVGFIQNLPHALIAAFKSTLLELEYATIIFHVIDISNTNWKNHCEVVNKVFKEMGIKKEKIIHIINKIDMINQEEGIKEIESQLPTPYILISARDKIYKKKIEDYLKEKINN